MNDHFTPVGNPAPPRPRSPDSFTMLTMSAGAMPNARSNATYPPRLRQPSRVVAPISPKCCDRTVVSLACGVCGKPILFVSRKEVGNAFRRYRLDEILIDHHRRREPTRTEALDLDDRELVVRRRHAQLLAARVAQERVDHFLRAADLTGRRRAHLNEVA